MIADLCESCRRPLGKLMGSVAEGRRPRVGVAALPVLSVEDVEKLRRRGGRARRRPPESPSEQR